MLLANASLLSLNLSERPNFSGPFEKLSSCSTLPRGRSRLCAFISQWGLKWRKYGVMVRITAENVRARTETPSAYHLTDEDESGEAFGIRGGIGDGSSISSKDVPNISNVITGTASTKGSRSANPVTLVRNNDSHESHSRRLGQCFGRLKHQRLKVLVNKASSKKQRINQQDCIEQVTRATKSQERRDVREIRLPKPCEPDNKVPGPDLSASTVSATLSSGWGNMESVHNIEYRMPEHVKKKKMLSFDSDFFSQKTFIELGCREYMIESLKGQLLFRPSHIQAMAFGRVFEGKSCIIADQSGSGKTFSYLVPIIQRLRHEEVQGLGKSFSKSPRAVILVPTAELASQVLNDCRSISRFGVPFRSMVATGGFRQRTQLENLQQSVDVLIATPGRFEFLIKEGAVQFTNLRCAVLDEVDVLFKDEDFEPALKRLINSSPVSTQYLFVTATLPKEVYNKIVEVFPDAEVISGPGVHRISPRLEEVLVDCSGDGPGKNPVTAFINKKSALLQLVEKSPVSKTIVFCNKIETCRKIENVLKRFDRKECLIRVLPFHAAVRPESRLANLKEFLSSRAQDSLFLVCTDRASRGIDFVGVDHVVLFDFPRDPSEYVRRVGRTARGASEKGKAFIFVVGKQVSLAWKIIQRNQKGHPLHDVPFRGQLMSLCKNSRMQA